MKVLVVDDHALVREGLRHVLQGIAADIEVLEAARCSAAFELAATHADVDLVLLDLNLPDMSGIEALDRFGLRYPEVPVIILSGNEDPTLMQQCFDRGADGFLPKSSMSQVLIEAVRLVLAGGIYVPPELFSSSKMSVASRDSLELTQRQREVLELLIDGLSNKEIARRLGISEQTVKAHVSVVLRALNVETRTQVVVAMARLGAAQRH